MHYFASAWEGVIFKCPFRHQSAFIIELTNHDDMGYLNGDAEWNKKRDKVQDESFTLY